MTTEAPTNTPTAATLREQRARLVRRLDRLREQAAALALDAMTSAEVSTRYRQAEAEQVTAAREVQQLDSAIATAEAREATAKAEADAQARAAQEREYEQADAAARQWVATIIASMPDASTLNAAQAMREDLIRRASSLGKRRPYDALDCLRAAMATRIASIERGRWAHTRITLDELRPHVVEAQARVTHELEATK